MRDIEVMYRNEQEQQLREEVAKLQTENREFLANSGDNLLEKLARNGLSFVTYQTGAGHINVPAGEISDFLSNPVQYTAEFCGTTESQYKSWLLHYQAPVCNHLNEEGELCGENIDRVGIPADFFEGESDRCEAHNHLNIDKESSPKDRSRPSHLKVVSGQ